MDKLEKTLNNFIKKNKLSKSVFKDLSSLKNLSKINSKITFSTNFGRDIEYYSGIVFEIYNSGKKEIARGGRYDGLLKSLGSKKNISAVGAAINLNNLNMKNLITIGLPSKGRLKEGSINFLAKNNLKLNFKWRRKKLFC